MRPFVCGIWLAACSRLLAAGVETQHAFDATLPLKAGLELVLHSRMRTQPGGMGFYQARAGPVLSWDAAPRFAILGGYYYARQERKIDNDFIGGHRFFGGTELIAAETRRFSLDQRLLAERFVSDATEDFNRYRLRTRVSFKATLAPYTSHEFFFDARGWRSNRHSAGIRWSVTPGIQLDMGYLYEHRRPDAGPARHMWLTSFVWKKGARPVDPKL